VQNALDLLGADGIEFQDRTVYRELFNLNTTAEKLADPVKRRQIIAFVAELIKASERLRAGSQDAIALVASASGYDAALIKRVWHEEGFPGTLVPDLPEVLTDEDAWLAASSQRVPRSRAALVALIDPSVRPEALALSALPSGRTP
jgi:NitT/TauT family transport system substrate-binding protein